MKNVNKKLIKGVIEEVNGLAFKNSEPYSESAKIFFQNRYSEIVKLLPEIKKEDLGLEIGLAGGVLAFVLRRHFNLNKLYTLEHPIVYKQYNNQFLNKLKNDYIILEPVNLEENKLPWPDNFFNFIFLCDVVEHLVPSDIPNLIREIKRVLRKDGYLVIVTPNIASLIKRINLFFGKNPIEFDLKLHEEATYGHIREYTMNELLYIVENENLKIKRKKYFMIDAKRNIFTRIEDLCSKIYRPFANSLALVIQK
nr:class I SAM-dependent methyltransferase [Candidatus Levybacteria bacterium]